MILFGNITNKNYCDQNYNFRLDAIIYGNNSYLLNTENDEYKNLFYIDGDYTLEITKNDNTIFDSGKVYENIHPIEILARIENNKNWDIHISEVFSNDTIEWTEFISAVESVVIDEYEYKIDEEYLTEFLLNNSDAIQEYFNQMLYCYCIDNNSFLNTWEKVEKELTSNDIDTKNYIYSGTFVDDTNLIENLKLLQI